MLAEGNAIRESMRKRKASQFIEIVEQRKARVENDRLRHAQIRAPLTVEQRKARQQTIEKGEQNPTQLKQPHNGKRTWLAQVRVSHTAEQQQV